MPAGGRSTDDRAHRRVHEKLDETPRNSAAAVSDVSLQRQPDEWPTEPRSSLRVSSEEPGLCVLAAWLHSPESRRGGGR
jgi:hypothetical protein